VGAGVAPADERSDGGVLFGVVAGGPVPDVGVSVRGEVAHDQLELQGPDDRAARGGFAFYAELAGAKAFFEVVQRDR
jgi:hypothetical protein